MDEVSNVAVSGGGPTIVAGPDVPPYLLQAAVRLLGPYGKDRGGGPDVSFVLGRSAESRDSVSVNEVAALSSPDSFLVRSGKAATGGTLFVCVGRTHRGTGFAFFELLQQLGFAFLHPFKPVLPEALPQPFPVLDLVEDPRWEFRGTHYHTQHPLELTNLLNGYDTDGQHLDRDRWAATFPEWEAFLEWMLANKQTYVEWMLLADRKGSPDNGGFEMSDERRWRLTRLVQVAHERGIEVGVDAPLTQQQQHALSLLPQAPKNLQKKLDNVKYRLTWLLECGFDHLGTELGSTEFTTGLPARDLVDILSFIKEQLGPHRRLLVKNHCSTDQLAQGFRDPRSGAGGAELNFNYLSYYADPSIVAMPHTVQAYSLRDPAPTYGNTNFSDLRDWTKFLLQSGRPVVFYPETSYWVNYDISVPLFLAPAYVRSRVADAQDVDSMNGPGAALGQLNFESGWQWGYWLANSAQAAVAWQVFPDTASVYNRIFRFLEPVLRGELVSLLCDFGEAQKRLLIDGLQAAPSAPGIGRGSVTGIAYIQGSEGLSDFAQLLARYFGKGAPQPDRLRFTDLWSEEVPVLGLTIFRVASGAAAQVLLTKMRQKWYHKYLQPLLTEMVQTFAVLAKRFEDLAPAPASATESVKDLSVSAKLLSLRCSQVLALYDHAASCGSQRDAAPPDNAEWCRSRLTVARSSLEAALALVPEREEKYYSTGDDHRRVSGWRAGNPTAYNFGYLWAAHELFYWQRDQAIVEHRIRSSCFGNINDPLELGLQGGGGHIARVSRAILRTVLSNRFWHVGLADCLGISEEEPTPLAHMASDHNAPQSTTFVALTYV